MTTWRQQYVQNPLHPSSVFSQALEREECCAELFNGVSTSPRLYTKETGRSFTHQPGPKAHNDMRDATHLSMPQIVRLTWQTSANGDTVYHAYRLYTVCSLHCSTSFQLDVCGSQPGIYGKTIAQSIDRPFTTCYRCLLAMRAVRYKHAQSQESGPRLHHTVPGLFELYPILVDIFVKSTLQELFTLELPLQCVRAGVGALTSGCIFSPCCCNH